MAPFALSLGFIEFSSSSFVHGATSLGGATALAFRLSADVGEPTLVIATVFSVAVMAVLGALVFLTRVVFDRGGSRPWETFSTLPSLSANASAPWSFPAGVGDSCRPLGAVLLVGAGGGARATVRAVAMLHHGSLFQKRDTSRYVVVRLLGNRETRKKAGPQEEWKGVDHV
jgi:hypothetical protein